MTPGFLRRASVVIIWPLCALGLVVGAILMAILWVTCWIVGKFCGFDGGDVVGWLFSKIKREPFMQMIRKSRASVAEEKQAARVRRALEILQIKLRQRP